MVCVAEQDGAECGGGGGGPPGEVWWCEIKVRVTAGFPSAGRSERAADSDAVLGDSVLDPPKAWTPDQTDIGCEGGGPSERWTQLLAQLGRYRAAAAQFAVDAHWPRCSSTESSCATSRAPSACLPVCGAQNLGS